MYLEEILKIMSPSNTPSEVPLKSDWITVEETLGVALPHDYKEFIQTYGTGKIDDFLYIFSPFSQNENLNLLYQLRLQADIFSELKLYGEMVPFQMFPEKNGIFPFAITDNGDLLFWHAIDEPDTWTILANDARSAEWLAYNMPMSKFLLELISHKLKCSIFPKIFPSVKPTFEISH